MTSFIFGSIGVLLVEFWDIFETRKTLNWPEYLKTSRYWIPTICMTLLGGALATQAPNSAYLACIQIGASAPLILSRLINKEEV